MRLNNRTSFILAIALCFMGLSHAQNEIDALRFSQDKVAGTARGLALGGAMSAVGADFSSTFLNPAGLGLYRKSDLLFSPSFRIFSTQTDYLNENANTLASNFGFANAGFTYGKVLTEKDDEGKVVEKKKGFKGFGLSLGFSQVANYNQSRELSAYNDESSITQFFTDQAQGLTNVELSGTNSFAGLGWAAGVFFTDTTGIPGRWLPAVKNGDIQQAFRITESGRKNDWSLGFGGNVSDFIYFGAGVGLQDLNYRYDMRYEESDINNIHQNDVADSSSFSRLDFDDEYQTRGIGFNARAGIIVRPLPYLRVALSATTPTWYNLRDRYYSALTANFDGDDITYGLEDENNPEGEYRYTLITPFKLTAGVMAIYKKIGFITADVDILDYSSTRLVVKDVDGTPIGVDPFEAANASIKDNFKFSYNLRVGAEARYKIMRFRLGFANYGSALKKEAREFYEFSTTELKNIPGSRLSYSGGIGIKQKNYYIDLTYVRDVSWNRQLLYTLEDPAKFSPDLISKRVSNSFLMTIGFTF